MEPNLPEDLKYLLVVARNLTKAVPSRHLFTPDVLMSAAGLAWVSLSDAWESSGRPCSWGAFRGRRARWVIQKILYKEGLLRRPQRHNPVTAGATGIPEEFLAEIPDRSHTDPLDPSEIPGISPVEASILRLRYLQGVSREETMDLLGLTRYQYNQYHLQARKKASCLL